MDDTKERLAIIDWIKRALANTELTPAALGRAIWPDDRSILGKVLANKRRVQIAELAQIAAVTNYPPYLGSKIPEVKADPSPRRKPGFFVKEWRVDSEVTEEKAAAALAIDLDIYQTMERRPYNFSEDQVKVIAAVLNIPFDRMRFPPEARKTKQAVQRVTKSGARSISVRRK